MIVDQKFIANAVGVSQKTVSLYFSERGRIAPETRKRIAAVVQKYRYFPNSAARSISSNRFNRIACVVAQFGKTHTLAHPHLMAYINGASFELAKHGYALTIEPVFIDRDSLNVDFPECFSTRSVDGIIAIAGSWIPPEVDQRIIERELPTVWLNRASDHPRITGLRIDEVPGAKELARFLLDSGRRRVGWFGPEFEHDQVLHYSSRQRYETLAAELAAAGAECFPTFSQTSDMRDDSARRLLAGFSRLDAVVCYNFHYRETLIEEAVEAGLDLRPLLLAHFASAWECDQQTHHFAHLVRLPEAELGRRGAQYILARLRDEDTSPHLIPLTGKLQIGRERTSSEKITIGKD